jgi:hypothetical protein
MIYVTWVGTYGTCFHFRVLHSFLLISFICIFGGEAISKSQQSDLRKKDYKFVKKFVKYSDLTVPTRKETEREQDLKRYRWDLVKPLQSCPSQ